MPKKTYTWVWIAGAVLLLLGLVYLAHRWYTEGFEDITGKKKSFVVQASLATLTSIANQNKIGSVQTGAYDAKFAIATITDYKDTEVWKAGQSPSTDSTVKQYRLNFPSEITVSGSEGGASRGALSTKVNVFFPKLAEKGIPATELSYIGDDFSSDFIIVKGDPGLLIDPFNTGNPDNNFKGTLSSFGGKDIRPPDQSPTSGETIVVGKTSSDYAVNRILNEAMTVYYSKSDFGKRDFYKVLFDKDVDLKRIKEFVDLAKSPSLDPDDPNISAVNKALSQSTMKLLTLKGVDQTDTRTDFSGITSKVVVFEGPLHAVLNPATRNFMKNFSTAGDTLPTEIKDTANKNLWTKAASDATLRIEFVNPVNLRVAKQQIPRKISGAKYVGLDFKDTPAADLPVDEFGIRRNPGAVAQVRSADYSSEMKILTDTPPEKQFPASFLASGEGAGTSGAGTQETPASPNTTEETTYRDVKPTGTDFSGYIATMTPATNRFRVRAKWSVLSKPGMIATLGIAAGKLGDGTYPKVVEILNSADKKIWPEGSAGAVQYVDTGVTELFTIGYDVMIDPKTSFERYVQTYMPSIVYVNPAMPRT